MTESKPDIKKEGAPSHASGGGQQSQPRSGSGGGSRGERIRNSFRCPSNIPTGRAIIPKSTFKGDNATLAVFIFDSVESYRANDFETPIEGISGYVAKKYYEGPDIRLVVLRLKRPTLMPPVDPVREYRSDL